MSKTRRNHSPAFKAKVAVEALQGHRTIHEIASHHQVHPNQVTQWRRKLIEQATTVFADGQAASAEAARDREALLAKIGSLTMERDFLSRAFGK
jgi:transposase